MNRTKRTEISSLGEFGFIERLTKDITPVNKETVKGIGDDAAILQFSNDIVGHVPTKELGANGRIVHGVRVKFIDCGASMGGTLGCLCLENGEEFYV